MLEPDRDTIPCPPGYRGPASRIILEERDALTRKGRKFVASEARHGTIQDGTVQGRGGPGKTGQDRVGHDSGTRGTSDTSDTTGTRGVPFTRRAVLAAGAAGLAALAAGCSAGNAPGQTSGSGGPEKTSLQVGALKSVTAAGLYIAQQRGFFKDAGLDVTIVPTTGSGPVMADLLAGRLDVSFGNYVSFIEAQAKGVASLKILDEGNNAISRQQGLVVMPHSPVTSLRALAGKTIGVNALENLAQILLASLLAGQRLSLSAVKLVAVPFPDMGSALAAGRIDAALLVEPYLTEARLQYGTVTIADSNQGATADLPVSGYIATAAWAAKYPQTAAAFVRALNRGQTLANTSRTAVEQVMTKYTGASARVASLVVAGEFPTDVSQPQMQRVADLMHQYGMLRHAFNVAPMIGGARA
jgi:NitT/TauT family transport system substrate-binding protein